MVFVGPDAPPAPTYNAASVSTYVPSCTIPPAGLGATSATDMTVVPVEVSRSVVHAGAEPSASPAGAPSVAPASMGTAGAPGTGAASPPASVGEESGTASEEPEQAVRRRIVAAKSERRSEVMVGFLSLGAAG
jgi:hypothetical protein